MDDRPQILSAQPEGELHPLSSGPEPFGETPYLELIEAYAELARGAAGAPYLLLRDMPDLGQARAAVLGARAAGIPVYVTMQARPDGQTPEPQELLAALICLQELGAAGFGLETCRVDAELLELYTHLLPYAHIPLMARLQGPADAETFQKLLRAGVTLLSCPPEQQDAAAQAAARHTPVARPPRPEDAPLLLCDASGVYYLEEDFTLSDEVECSLDMADEILEMEDRAYDALCFHIETADDAHFFGLNAHMVRQAVCILAEDAGLLELSLALYPGRAIVDARSDTEETAMLALAKSYGAIVR